MFLGISKALWVALCVTLLACMGLSLPYPVLTPLFIDAEVSSLNSFAGLSGETLLTILLAIYPLGIFIGSSFIGALSDRFGRRRVLSNTLMICFLGYLASAYALYIGDYLLLVISRFLTGITEGNIAIARAIALDIGQENSQAQSERQSTSQIETPDQLSNDSNNEVISPSDEELQQAAAHASNEKVRAVSLINSSVFVGWLLGPLIGGSLGHFEPYYAMFAAAVASLLCVILVKAVLGETAKVADTVKMSVWQSAIKENSLRMLSDPWLRKLFYMYFIYTLAMNLFYEFYPIWLVDKQGFGSLGIGLTTTNMTIFMTLSSIFLVTLIKRHFGLTLPMLLSMVALSGLLILLPFTDSPMTNIVFSLAGISIAVYNGMLPVFISDNQPSKGNGAAMGLLTTTFCIANVFAAIFGGVLLQLDSVWPLFLASALYFIAMLLMKVWFIKSEPEKKGLAPLL